MIPSRNQARFLAGALDSLAAQDYPDLEVIVMDGGSTDGTVELLKGRSDVVTHWVSEPDDSQTNALNEGYRMATGQVLAELDCDEQYLPGALRLVGETFAREPDLDIVFGHRILVDLDGREIGRMRLPAIHPRSYALYASGLLFSDTTFWTAKVHRATGELDEVNCPRCVMDFDWFGRLALNVRRWKRLNTYISQFTEHEGRAARNAPEIQEVAHGVRRRLLKLAGIGPLRVMLMAPLYFFPVRYGQFGWRGLLRPPSPLSLLRVAGIVQ